ncbi:MAG: zinc-binding dehydrogenase [Actinomycetia bacterium]|nr:zinc-binding dehydrogenase [Actinomycetes bacterium]
MRAVRFHEFGNADVLRLEEVDDPTPGEGQITIRIRASALNHLDVDVREGVSRFPVTMPHTLGIEVAGEIETLGEGVEGWQVGDRVMPFVMDTCEHCRFCRSGRETLCLDTGFISFTMGGGYAEKLACAAGQLVRVPDNVSYEQAVATQVAFATSWHMLFTRGRLVAGETVLINSVSSGIGSAAVQLAKLAGAYVIGNSSTQEKLDRAAELGMDVGINHNEEDVAARVMEITDEQGVDLAYEHVGGKLFQAALDSLGKDGRMVICGGHSGEVVDFDIIPFFRTQKSVIGSFVFSREEVEQCLQLAARGQITPLVHSTYRLEQAADAMQALERREQFGKIVITP